MPHKLTLTLADGEQRSFTFETRKQAEIYALVLLRLDPQAMVVVTPCGDAA
jgi:hypothetical protein